MLLGGGSMVTYAPASAVADTPGRDWTMVLEKIRASTGPCLRDNFKNDTMHTERITLILEAGLRTDVSIQTWRSDWSKGAAVAESELFQPAPDARVGVDAGGRKTLTVTIAADQVVTMTTLQRAAGFGNHPKPTPPASKPFPAGYKNDFDASALNSEEPYLSDQVSTNVTPRARSHLAFTVCTC